MSNKKYEFTNETKKVKDVFGDIHTLHRIKALKDFGYVHKGDLGGWLEKESNLSQGEDCWVYGNAHVYDDAQVYGFAGVYDNAQVYGNAQVYDEAWVSGNSVVCGDTEVLGVIDIGNHPRGN